jgi:hypothetical protein
MKFTDLTSYHRSMLTMLCTGQTFSTAELGRGCNPSLKPDQAAASLLRLRDLGLVFSNQKPPGQAYAMWKASEYGQAVFMSRPAEVTMPCSNPVLDALPTAEPAKPYRVLRVSDAEVTLFGTKFATEEEADRFARTNIHNAGPDVRNYVVTVHAAMKFVAPVHACVERIDL